MAITTIHDWLVARGDFDLGVTLLRTHAGITYEQDLLFRDGETSLARQELVLALREVNDAHAAPAPAASNSTRVHAENPEADERIFRNTIQREALSQIPIEALPPPLQEVRKELNDLHRQRSFLRGKLSATPDGLHLYDLAGQVLDLTKRIKAGWGAIEAYRSTGHLVRPDPERDVHSAGDLKLELQRLRVYINRVDKGHRTAEPSVYEAWKARKSTIESMLDAAAQA